MKASRIIISLFLLLTACNRFSFETAAPTMTVAPTVQVPPTSTPQISTEAAEYLNDALDIMQNYSINRDQMDWPALRAEILASASAAKTPADTYPFIKIALTRLNDHHSIFLDPQTATAAENGTSPTPMPPETRLLENRFGYVTVPAYWGLNEDLINRYGTDMQKQIEEIDRLRPCGWIVDLRGNTGGNMWPMLIGIGPILGEGEAGSWIDAHGRRSIWAYLNGKGMSGNQVVSHVIGEPYRIENPDAPVAVLFGSATGSSGEIIVISFIGRNNTRSFGSDSGGYTTANEGFPLSDQAMIFLTTAVDADRTGKTYGGVISPDVITSGDNNQAGPVPEEALQWLSDQPVCQ
jgi:C-terminal processing protease CtpA/Prc